MLWGAERLGVDKKKLTLATAKCANTVRHLMDDERSRNAVDTFIAYGEGRATKEEFEEAIAAADADAAYYAAEAASFAASASYYASGESKEAREANQLQTANICREILTNDIIKIIEIIEIIEKH